MNHTKRQKTRENQKSILVNILIMLSRMPFIAALPIPSFASSSTSFHNLNVISQSFAGILFSVFSLPLALVIQSGYLVIGRK